jgi:AraC-like DNA-binding protein
MSQVQDLARKRLSTELLRRLQPFSGMGETALSEGEKHKLPGRIFSYCCFRAERIARVSTRYSMIGIVLSGQKEFWLEDHSQLFTAGDVFVFPANVTFDVVNIPDGRTGRYESLLVEVHRVPEHVLRAGRKNAFVRHKGLDMRIELDPDLVDALGHAAVSLASPENAETIGPHRLAEVLLLLRDRPAARCLFEAPLADRVRWVVLGEPSRQWTAASIARELGMGASTLRRWLAAEATSLREVLVTARMEVAHDILARGEGNVTAAAGIAGYSSRSHFIRHFRNAYGVLPNAVRRQGAA